MERETKKQKLEFTNENGFKTTVELPWDASGRDYLQALVTIMISQTFYPENIYTDMKDFAEENLPSLLEENQTDK